MPDAQKIRQGITWNEQYRKLLGNQLGGILMSCNSCNSTGIFAFGNSWWWIIALIIIFLIWGGNNGCCCNNNCCDNNCGCC